MAKNEAATSALAKTIKPGRYVFQLLQKVDPLVDKKTDPKANPNPPYPPKKQLPGKTPVFDEETESLRLARVVPGSPTIWVDEQIDKKIDDKRADENAWSPEFIYGVLELNAPQDNLKILRMLLDDRYDKKKIKAETGKQAWFTMIDENANAVKTIEQLREIKKAEDAAWDAAEEFESIEGHAKFLGVRYMDGSRKRTQDAIISDYINKAKSDPALFLKTINSPIVQIKAAIQKAIDNALINLSNVKGEAQWSDTGAFITKLDMTKEAIDSLLEFATSGKEGEQFIATVKELIKGK